MSEGLHVYFARDPKYHDSMNIPKLNVLLIFTFYYKYLKYKNIFNLGFKTVLYLKYDCINCLVGV